MVLRRAMSDIAENNFQMGHVIDLWGPWYLVKVVAGNAHTFRQHMILDMFYVWQYCVCVQAGT